MQSFSRGLRRLATCCIICAVSAVSCARFLGFERDLGRDEDPGDGKSGAPGSEGKSGAPGSDGVSGAAGSDGVSGAAGSDSVSGAAGSAGADGGSAAMGAAGVPSTSCGDTPVGSSKACNELPDGSPINFPGGQPQGPCAAGTQLCQSDGSFTPCSGAVAPQPSDCSASNDQNCDGKPDNSECGQCTVGATQYCYDGLAGTSGVGSCSQGTQVCRLDASGKQAVWGPCAGEVTPAANDTCDAANDANCNHLPNEGCGCINGSTQSCGTTGTACTLGNRTCQSGALGACAGNVCADFAVPAPSGKCTAVAPKNEQTEKACVVAVCSTGYHVMGCSLFISAGSGSCSFNGADAANATLADVTTDTSVAGGTTTCAFSSCTCRHDGF